MTEDVGEIFAVVAEWRDQGPVLMETEGPETSLQAARDQMHRMIEKGSLRAAIVRITYERGNELLIHDLKRMQK